MAATAAKRLYYDSPELEFEAVVTDVRLQTKDEQGQVWQVALDRTAFYPESGGQPWDTGVLIATARSGATLEVAVERVEEDEAGEVWHTVRKPLVGDTRICGRVDADRRVDHMQQHSGQHLLSAIFLRELSAKTVSFHLGEESSTIDLQLPAGASALDEEQLRMVERLANQAMFEDRPLRTVWVSREDAEAMLQRGELRKLPDRAGPMRIIEMKDVEFNACGGTHVGSTGAIGGLVIRRVEKVRGGPRVEFCCGLRAVQTARKGYEILGKVAMLLSVGAVSVPERVGALLSEVKASAKAQRAVLDELARAEAERLMARVEGEPLLKATFADRDVEFAKRVAAHVAAHGHVAVVGATNGEAGSVVLARRAGAGWDAGTVLREVLSAHGARGGGAAEMAQGVCTAAQMEGLVHELGERVALLST